MNKNILTIISIEQCRAARGFLGWSQLELAEKVRVGKTAICDFERGKTTPHKKTLEDIRTVFKDAGIEFIDGEKVEGLQGLKGNVVIKK